MIDTVGFIRDLPTDLVDAFKSTLEETFFADSVLLLFDTDEDDDDIRSKLSISLQILSPEIESKKITLVGTKIDRIDASRRKQVEELARSVADTNQILMLSSKSGEGLDDLRTKISATQNRTHELQFNLPLADASYSLLSRLHEIADIEHHVDEGLLHVRLLCSPTDAEKVQNWLLMAGGRIS
jgi:GTP-binding protein HflX